MKQMDHLKPRELTSILVAYSNQGFFENKQNCEMLNSLE